VDIVLRGVQPTEEFALEMPRRSRAAPWFDALFRGQYPRIVGMLARLLGDRAQAEEVGADVFYKLASRPVPNGDELVAWVYRVAMNAGLDALRSTARRKRREREAGVENARSASGEGALEDLLRQERCARVRAVLADLKPRDAQLLLLRADGLAYRELARSLGIQPASVGTLLARAEAEFERKFRARYGGCA